MTAAPDLPDEATWRAWGIDPAWSRVVNVDSHDGSTHRWHILDTGPIDVAGIGATILCVHGNPTWSYAWKTFLTRFAGRHRVIAVDQLGMGFSDRVGHRKYAARVQDLADIINALELDTEAPFVLAAHDWGGAIAMGWAVEHPREVSGMVLCNTGIGVPEGRGAPKIIRLAAAAPLRDLVCRRTRGFVEGTVRLSGRQITSVDREAFRAPYRRAVDRQAIADFVGDVPLRDGHPSAQALQDVSDRLGSVDAPVLLAWGARDIVFDDDFANDLARRLPNTKVHRFSDANHLVMAEADVAATADVWLGDIIDPAPRPERPPTAASPLSAFAGIDRHRTSTEIAVHDEVTGASISFATFAKLTDGVAATLIERGLRPGDRVAMFTPPGVDLLVAVYGVWRAGGVTVIADRGLGVRGLGAAVASTRPKWTIGPLTARVASGVLRWAPRSTHLDVGELMSAASAVSEPQLPDLPDGQADVAVLFTSGATGPAKGVRYRHGQLAAQRDALAATYDITDDDRLVAAFAPFALYGPSLGVPTAFTDCDVTTPGDLTARSLDAACNAIGATMAFASPAALANVAATATERSGSGMEGLRLVFSAGAPVPAEMLRKIQALAPNAELHTPYGMTEALPVADIALDDIETAEALGMVDAGVCVGRPVQGAEVMIASLDFDAFDGVPTAEPTGRWGEILVRAPWVSEGYLGRWQTERNARPGAGWHRTGDVGQLDDDGRLWVDGRAVHVIRTGGGPMAPVPLERCVERALGESGMATVGRVAAVGVGPDQCQQIVIVIERPGERAGLADESAASAVRSAVPAPVAAVLVTRELPVDIRHNAKIDRRAVAEWASRMLAGERPRAARWRRR